MIKEFQSTPPAEARGDCDSRPGVFARRQFQSTPPAEARGDKSDEQREKDRKSFNPLPPPKRGETLRSIVRRCVFDASFNPLPPPKRGETHRLVEALWLAEFQSTPPAEARGDLNVSGTPSTVTSFNPLPPPKRGETSDPGRPDSTVVYGSLSAIPARQLAPIDRRRAKICC